MLCDILGLESLSDEITSKLLASTDGITPSAILGPFYRENAPILPNGGSIVKVHESWAEAAVRDSAFITGRVFSGSKEPISGAIVDVWLSAPNGLYEQQDDAQAEMNLRGRFQTDANGRYSLYALRPTPYPIPSDGPAGRFLQLLDRHPFRPAHIHFIVSAPGFRALTTQVFDSRDKYITTDSVFAVKEELVVEFVPRERDENAKWTLEYDFVLGEDL